MARNFLIRDPNKHKDMKAALATTTEQRVEALMRSGWRTADMPASHLYAILHAKHRVDGGPPVRG